MLTTDLSNHLALVTGATGGIGKATCLALAAMGCSIAVHYNSSTDTAEQVVKQLGSKGVKAKACQANLGNYEDVRSKLDGIKIRAVNMESDKLNIGSSTTC